MSAPSPRKRFTSIMLLILAIAALAWALLRGYNTAQDHRATQAAPGIARS